MSSFVLADDAGVDIAELTDYLIEFSPGAAIRLRDELLTAFTRLAEYPHLGHHHVDLTRLPVRFWPVMGRYMIVYEPNQPLRILRVFSGYRDIAALLG